MKKKMLGFTRKIRDRDAINTDQNARRRSDTV